MILKRKLYSEAGKKKLEERAKKRANKIKWQLKEAKEAGDHAWKGDSLEYGEKHAQNKAWLNKKSNEEVLDLLDKSAVSSKSTPRDLFGDKKRYYKNVSEKEAKEMLQAENALRAGRESIDLQNRGYDTLAKSKKYAKPQDVLMKSIDSGKGGALDEHMMNWELKRKLEKDLAGRKVKIRIQKLKKATKKAAPWVIGGSLAAAGTVAGVKAIKKKKSKKEEK